VDKSQWKEIYNLCLTVDQLKQKVFQSYMAYYFIHLQNVDSLPNYCIYWWPLLVSVAFDSVMSFFRHWSASELAVFAFFRKRQHESAPIFYQGLGENPFNNDKPF